MSGLVAAGALIPLIGVFLNQFGGDGAQLPTSAGLAFVNGSVISRILIAPFALAVYAVVWLASHAINILILLSPWGVVDAVLKSGRAALLSAVAGISMINPWIGALLSLAVIVLAYFLAGWSFRLLIFGCVFSWDFFTRRRKRFEPDPAANWAFTACAVRDVPIRTYGKLEKASRGGLRYRYRPWLLMQERVWELLSKPIAIGNGFFYPELVATEGESSKTLFNFPPRYRTHEEELGQIYGLEVRDVGLLKGLKAIGYCISELFGFSRKKRATSTAVA